MRDLEALEQALAKSGKAGQLQALADSPEGKRLASQFDAKALEKTVSSGDTAALQRALRQILSTQEGRVLAEKLNSILK